jgi:uncharacterized membrane protein
MMFGNGSHWVLWQLAVMWAGMTLVLVLVVWAVCSPIASATRRTERGARDLDVRLILDQRLAAGEIDDAEYDRLNRRIGHDDAPAGQTNRR